MPEQGQGSKDQGDQDQVKAPSSGEHENETGDPALGTGQGSTSAPPEVAGPSLSEIADPHSTEIADILNFLLVCKH